MISYPWDSIVEAMGDDGFPIYDRDYKAADLQSLNGRIFSNGVFMDEPDAFVVTPADGMNVILSTGWCCINGTFGNEPNMRELAIQSSASTQDRIDTVVLRWNANIEMRNIDVYVKTGVASGVPVRPTLTRDSTVYELGIADIFVPRGSGAISAARITDTRLQADRCGAVTPFMQIDTTTFFDQIQSAIDERTAELEEQTAKAVELAQSAIDGTTAGNLQSQIDANTEAIDENKTAIESNKATDDERYESLRKKTDFSGSKKVTSKYSIGANGWAEANFTVSGNLEVIGLCGFSSGNKYVSVTEVEVRNGSANMSLRNEANSQIDNLIASVIFNTRPLSNQDD